MWPVNRPEAIRINALNAAVEFLGPDAPSSDAVVQVAHKFEDYIINGKYGMGGL